MRWPKLTERFTELMVGSMLTGARDDAAMFARIARALDAADWDDGCALSVLLDLAEEAETDRDRPPPDGSERALARELEDLISDARRRRGRRCRESPHVYVRACA